MREEFWLRETRAKHLSAVHLTRRDDLEIREQPRANSVGYDLLVCLKPYNYYTGRIFGVQARALLSPRQVRRAASGDNAFRLNVKPYAVPAGISLPVCFFVFIMQTDEGYYRWLRQPVTQAGGNGYLLANESETFHRLDNQALAEIVAEVGQWYEGRLKIPA